MCLSVFKLFCTLVTFLGTRHPGRSRGSLVPFASTKPQLRIGDASHSNQSAQKPKCVPCGMWGCWSATKYKLDSGPSSFYKGPKSRVCRRSTAPPCIDLADKWGGGLKNTKFLLTSYMEIPLLEPGAYKHLGARFNWGKIPHENPHELPVKKLQ